VTVRHHPSGQTQPGAVFLDRDGTIIEEIGYLHRIDQVSLYPWSIDAIRALNRSGFRVVLVTNQSGIARGFLTEAIVDEVHRHLAALLAEGGARIDAYYYCPHHPDGTIEAYVQRCACRKPGRALVDRAVDAFGIDPARSFVIGDRWLDVELARAIGGRGILVRTGYGAAEEQRPPPALTADAIVDNLVGAVGWVLRHLQL
jgi:D-glycero-D-manno-heptose 1,7-bisphosphate phosphatase